MILVFGRECTPTLHDYFAHRLFASPNRLPDVQTIVKLVKAGADLNAKNDAGDSATTIFMNKVSNCSGSCRCEVHKKTKKHKQPAYFVLFIHHSSFLYYRSMGATLRQC